MVELKKLCFLLVIQTWKCQMHRKIYIPLKTNFYIFFDLIKIENIQQDEKKTNVKFVSDVGKCEVFCSQMHGNSSSSIVRAFKYFSDKVIEFSAVQ